MLKQPLLFVCILLLYFTTSLYGQDDEFKYGLVAKYQSGGAVAQQIDTDIAFHWGKSAPHAQIAPSDWRAQWTGQILLRSVNAYRLHAQVNGTVNVKIDGREVLAVSTDESAWHSGEEVNLPPGFQNIEVSYQPSEAGAEVKLYWSNEDFAVEPIPSHQLFHTVDSSRLQLIEKGRQLVDAHHCENCHRSEKTIDHLETAPALWGVVSGTNPDWIVDKLLGKNPETQSDEMPHFGFTEKQAEDIAAYLHRLEAPFDLMTAPDSKVKKGEMNGNELFNSLGCLACHQVNGLGTDHPFSGGDLSHIGNKRSADWFATWLASPERINPNHRMPTFKLNRTERGLLAAYLASLGREEKTRFGRAQRASYTESSIRGQNLVKEFQCANCHKIPAIEATNQPAPPLHALTKDWENSCLSGKPDRDQQRPYFPQIERDAVKSYLSSLNGEAQSLSRYARGQQVLERRQCLACHARGGKSGLKSLAKDIVKATPALLGQTQLVIPPNLNAVGDKLQDEVLDVALSGKQDRVRADWLKVQMPKFQHSDEELEALKFYLTEHDRIPSQATQQHPKLELTDTELLLIGRKLVGAGGWSCIACHQIGDYVPKNTALGTRGSNLMEIGKRLRPEFYYRWTKAPIRVIPGMEMPSFTKPVLGVLEDDVHKQLGAIFKAMNDPRFKPPTNPSQVEQLWQVSKGESPRIVRDVFTVGEEDGGGTVARAFAIGFDNQHGVLLDLNQMTIRDWRFGDFARQKTIGKSWYWDLAGVPLAKGFVANSSFVLIDVNDNSVIKNLVGTSAERIAHLENYRVSGDQVVLNYKLQIQHDGSLTLPVVEEWQVTDLPMWTGFTRKITVGDIPEGWLMGVQRPALEKGLFNISAGLHNTAQALHIDDGSGVSIPEHQDGTATFEFEYRAEVAGEPTSLPLKETPLAITDKVTTWPGYVGERLRLPISVMPTSITQDEQGRVLTTSLKGDVVRISDSDKDGVEDKFELLQEGLSAPFGILADGQDILVTHKPEVLRLMDFDGDDQFETRMVIADGWGHSDNYHDWVTGPVFDNAGDLFVATGSDYSQPKRDRNLAKWRGKVIRSSQDGEISAYAHELRYPIGIATDAHGRIFTSDQQGVQNTFNEINHIVQGGAYGVPGQLDGDGVSHPKLPAVQIPHPWTRSVNGIFFLQADRESPFAGHGVGCEYNGKFLIRFTTQEVNGELQGACYPLTRPTWKADGETFLGPICGYAAKDGSVYIGSIYDSGWLGGPNVGEVVKLKPNGNYGNGIREIRAVSDGFEIEFIKPIDSTKGADSNHYSVSGYTRVWQGAYATDDSGRYSPEIQNVVLSDDHRVARLIIADLKPTFVYEFNVLDVGLDGEKLFPAFGAYTLKNIPQ